MLTLFDEPQVCDRLALLHNDMVLWDADRAQEHSQADELLPAQASKGGYPCQQAHKALQLLQLQAPHLAQSERLAAGNCGAAMAMRVKQQQAGHRWCLQFTGAQL